MKFRNFIIVLLAVLMAFAFASCKHEPATPTPEPQPEPGPGPSADTVYQIQVTEGVDKDYWNRDKVKLVWVEDVNEGDVITLKYRSERDIYQWDIRDGSLKWVYESKKGSFTDPVLGEDGWYTLTYTFAKDINGADVDYPNEQFGVFFRGNFVTTDIIEVKDITLNGKPLAIEEDTITSAAVLTGTEENPHVDHDWSVKNYAVLFATGTPGEVDKTPIAEKVVAGGHVTGAPIAREGYTLTIYTDTAHTEEFDQTLPINEEKIFYYQYVGVPRTVTLDPNGGAFAEGVDAFVTIANGDMFVCDAEPALEGKAFKAWYKDAECTTLWTMTDPVLGDMTLYAGYGDPRTVTFELNGGTFGEGVANTKIVADGNAVAMPATPTNGTNLFLGWFADEGLTTPYSFATPVEADITIYAKWTVPVSVTLNLNYEGAPEATVFKAPYGQAVAENDENLVPATRELYVFDGWYTDAACTTAYNYDTVLTADIALYANWKEATLYQLISTHNSAENPTSNDKFVIYYKGEGAQLANAGDTLSFRFRSTTTFTFFNIRGDKKWIYENESATHGMTSYETKEDGWTYVTYEFSDKDYSGADVSADAWWRLDFGSRTIVKGDVLEIQDFRFNNKPLEIAAANVVDKTVVGESIEPTYAVVEGGAYEWSELTVSFAMGENATAIDNKAVAFGKTIEAPEAVVAEGYVFAGWYADAEFTKLFDFALPLIKDTTIYARVGAKKVLTFDSQEGSAVAAINAAEGAPIEEPEEPTRLGYIFGGWYKEAGCENEFSFAAGIDADTTVYAKWIAAKAVTLNANGGTLATTTVYAESGKTMAKPEVQIGKAGYFFDKWTTDLAGENAFDFENTTIDADMTLYAQWKAPTKSYTYTATGSKDRFQWRFKESSVSMLDGIQPGDVITFQVKFTNAPESKQYRLRTYQGEKHICEETAFPEADGEGWISVTCTVPETIVDGQGLYVQFMASWTSGHIVDIKALAFNGVEIPISTSSTSSGYYPGAATTVVVNDL